MSPATPPPRCSKASGLARRDEKQGAVDDPSRPRNAAMSSAWRAGLTVEASTSGTDIHDRRLADVTDGQRRSTMPDHRTGSREEWQAARDELAKLEAEHAKLAQKVT